MKRMLSLVLLIPLAAPLGAQELRQSIERYVEARQKPILEELMDALSRKAVARERESSRQKAEFLLERFLARGFAAELLETDGNPLVWAEKKAPGDVPWTTTLKKKAPAVPATITNDTSSIDTRQAAHSRGVTKR